MTVPEGNGLYVTCRVQKSELAESKECGVLGSQPCLPLGRAGAGPQTQSSSRKQKSGSVGRNRTGNMLCMLRALAKPHAADAVAAAESRAKEADLSHTELMTGEGQATTSCTRGCWASILAVPPTACAASGKWHNILEDLSSSPIRWK